LSIITHDRLKKFNEIHGTVAGNALDEIAAAHEAAGEDFGRREEGQDEYDEEENKDTVSANLRANE
jgi:ribosomal protein L12E/L44/L45/RPP1/RPP2